MILRDFDPRSFEEQLWIKMVGEVGVQCDDLRLPSYAGVAR